MKKRIVFVNLHTNWMMLKVTDVILLKNSVALKHKYLLDYLLHNIDKYEVCTYLNSNCFSLYQRGSDKLQRILRPIGIKENEWIIRERYLSAAERPSKHVDSVLHDLCVPRTGTARHLYSGLPSISDASCTDRNVFLR